MSRFTFFPPSDTDSLQTNSSSPESLISRAACYLKRLTNDVRRVSRMSHLVKVEMNCVKCCGDPLNTVVKFFGWIGLAISEMPPEVTLDRC